LLRRFALWFLVVLVFASALASRLDSFVTFAGLITAGIAVAMQSVILSIVGYFFLIGKYGIRAGDRIQIGDVLGDVIDVGLVRMHLMEISRGGLGPTGRVVAFSNSIVFQATGGLFKYLAGVHFAWHEVTFTLAASSDAALVRERLLAAVDAALAEHKDEIERQSRELERTAFESGGAVLRPSVRLRFLATTLEAVVRYPVDQNSAGAIDEAVSRELLKALGREPLSLPPGATAPELKLNVAPAG
jgi:small-conductance mechanosensitive channel